MSALVCPECGHDQFTVDRPAVLRLTVSVYAHAGEDELSEERVDIEHDSNDLTCDDCGTSYLDCNPEDDLVTPEAYAREEELVDTLYD